MSNSLIKMVPAARPLLQLPELDTHIGATEAVMTHKINQSSQFQKAEL